MCHILSELARKRVQELTNIVTLDRRLSCIKVLLELIIQPHFHHSHIVLKSNGSHTGYSASFEGRYSCHPTDVGGRIVRSQSLK